MAREFSQKFYHSKSWIDFRNMYFNSRYGICEKCGNPGEELHHKIFLNAKNINDPNVTLNEDNCILLCKNCHNEEHAKAYKMHRHNMIKNYKPSDNRYIFDDKGNVIENMNVFIVHGAPASGKTRYVRQHKGKYDIVIDLDYIRSALTLGEDKDNIPDTVPYALDIRELLYDSIQNRTHYFDKAWIIAGLPKKADREVLANRLHAELIHIDTEKDICIAYAREDEERKYKNDQTKIINLYFEEYEP